MGEIVPLEKNYPGRNRHDIAEASRQWEYPTPATTNNPSKRRHGTHLLQVILQTNRILLTIHSLSRPKFLIKERKDLTVYHLTFGAIHARCVLECMISSTNDATILAFSNHIDFNEFIHIFSSPLQVTHAKCYTFLSL